MGHCGVHTPRLQQKRKSGFHSVLRRLPWKDTSRVGQLEKLQRQAGVHWRVSSCRKQVAKSDATLHESTGAPLDEG